ncbi:MAG: GHMP family kinase ATP-binding protein [Planctomycetota bacterium]|jgi:N-acetylgalactosamine kinase
MAVETTGRRPVNDWIDLIRDPDSAFHNKLDQIYGDAPDLKDESARMCLRTLEAFSNRFGPDGNVILIRSTGRVNVVGTHIDHRGGSVNPIAIKHMWLAVEPREDDLVRAKNVESDRFPDEKFRISHCLPVGRKIQDWDAWCHDEYEERRNDPAVSWSNYVRAAVLYLQHLSTDDGGGFSPTIKGMDMMVYGNVPLAAGLSSSSALVMLTTEAVMRINDLRLERDGLAEHCGFAEWYVGTRGGCSDHAAILSGESGKILHIASFPTTISSAELPPGYSFVLANSLVEAKKQAGARNAFNSRVAAYIFGLMMIRKNFPQYAERLKRLRDVNPRTIGVDQAEIYRMVKSLPASADRADIMKFLPSKERKIRRVFRSHDEPKQGYRIRQICLYGVAECIRAEMVPQCLAAGDMKILGELITISHDGDRATKLVDQQRVPVDNSYPDERIDALISDLESGDPERVGRAGLWRQGGGYNVSLPEIDELVDIALATPGVIGAGLVGAGMGGCIVAVVEDKHAPRRGLPVKAETIRPVGGLCTIDV